MEMDHCCCEDIPRTLASGSLQIPSTALGTSSLVIRTLDFLECLGSSLAAGPIPCADSPPNVREFHSPRSCWAARVSWYSVPVLHVSAARDPQVVKTTRHRPPLGCQSGRAAAPAGRLGWPFVSRPEWTLPPDKAEAVYSGE